MITAPLPPSQEEVLRENECFRAEVERLRAALTRLGGGEVLGPLPFAPNYKTNEGRELLARIDFARAVLNQPQGPTITVVDPSEPVIVGSGQPCWGLDEPTDEGSGP